MLGRSRSLITLLCLAACSSPPTIPDAAIDDAGQEPPVDSGVPNAGAVDAGSTDAGSSDAGRSDSGVIIDGGTLLCPPSLGAGAPFHLRAVAANLTSGNCQSWDPGPGVRILQGLAPDIVLMQEFNYYPSPPTGCPTTNPADIPALVDRIFPDAGYSCARGATGHIPNGVLSRWPIVDAGDWTDPRVTDRDFTWAHVDLPGPRDLWVVSVHLLTSSQGDRTLEGTALRAQLDALIPPGDFLLIGGDFNTDTQSENVYSVLAPRVNLGRPEPADQSGKGGTNTSRSKPYDHVLASPCLAALQIPTTIGAQGFDAGLVFDSRVFTPLSDVAPVLSTDSAAVNMQHMAAVKDFLVAP